MALDLAEQALLLSPGMGDAENLRGVALSLIGQPRAAEEAFSKAARAMPGLAKPLYNLAVHFYGLGRKQEALAWAEKALEREPGHALAFSLQALIQDGSEGLAQAPHPDFTMLALEEDAFEGPFKNEWLRENQATWMAIGWTLAAGNLVAMAFVMTTRTGSESSAPLLLFWLMLGSYAFTLIYVLVDVLGRDRSKLWIALFATVACFLGWALLPLYLLTSKKRRR